MSFSPNKIGPILIFIFALTLISLSLISPTFFTGYAPTLKDLFLSIGFFVAWFLFSARSGYKKDNFYKNFLFVYWGINLIVNLFSIFAPFNALLIFGIWFGGPVYGLEYLVSDLNSLKIMTPIIGLLVTMVGYWFGKLICDKISKTHKNK
jgi:hypothetical protein